MGASGPIVSTKSCVDSWVYILSTQPPLLSWSVAGCPVVGAGEAAMTEHGDDPYATLLTDHLAEKKWTDYQLEKHIVEAVKYGIRMERARILNSTKELTYE